MQKINVFVGINAEFSEDENFDAKHTRTVGEKYNTKSRVAVKWQPTTMSGKDLMSLGIMMTMMIFNTALKDPGMLTKEAASKEQEQGTNYFGDKLYDSFEKLMLTTPKLSWQGRPQKLPLIKWQWNLYVWHYNST